MVTLKDRVEDVEKKEIIGALKECNCVRTRAAKRLGITERMIGYKIKKYGLRIKKVVSVKDSDAEQQFKQRMRKWKRKFLSIFVIVYFAIGEAFVCRRIDAN